ncbi:hypothetical protein [Polaribacter cellanae]|uniref:HEXXH motif domain-containing protein n=1 Tax=Polaribacter cellanae TaxID=2818493 RepID=A0A975H615_9FLAO|nr:hypothetical protein [Polaribacter cellanae]QTE21991.1 hypothetical protein J3359_14400 [Polaribacter cellanae]
MKLLKDNKYSILNTVELLKFENDNSRELKNIVLLFVSNTKEKLNDLLNKEIKNGFSLVKEINHKLSLLSDKEVFDLIKTPKFLNIVYRPGIRSIEEQLSTINRFLDAEVIWKQERFDSSKNNIVWAINGKGCIRFTKDNTFSRYESPLLFDNVVLDFFSSYNYSLGKESYLTYNSNEELELHNFDEAELIVDKLEELFINTKENIREFINLFINVIHFKAIQNKKQYSSCTSGGYIGRVLIGNALSHRDELLIEAVIHEAIHGLLFMIDEINAWMPSAELDFTQKYNVQSPWTGNMLNIRNVLQACFVWYGLFTFWKSYETSNEFIKNRINFIYKGFKGLNLDSDIKLEEITLEAINKVKSEVINYE